MNEPKVSVCIVTYNHINFIQKCLDSLINQKVNFEFEILVSDDCSTDGTGEIISEYEEKYPHLVKSFSPKKNLGPQGNFLFVHQKAKGEYVSHMDGDDYALPDKLQMQADYLDQNPHCNIVWHRMNTMDKDELIYEDNYLDTGVVFKKFDIIDLVANITIGFNSSKMYRSNFEFKNRLEYYDLDFSFNALKLINPAKYAAFTGDSILGVYRSNNGISVTHNYQIKVRIYKWLLKFHRDNLLDRSLISAKIFLLLVSDIKHLKKTIFYGLYAFIATCLSFSLKAIWVIHSKKIPHNTKFKIIDKKSAYDLFDI